MTSSSPARRSRSTCARRASCCAPAAARSTSLLYLGSWFLGLSCSRVGVGVAAARRGQFAAVNVATFVLFLIVAPITVETLSHGKSLGKLAVGARIVRDDGGAIGLRHAFVRGLIGVFENYTGFAFIVGLFNSKAKRLGDMLAGTYSQHERFPQFTVPVLRRARARSSSGRRPRMSPACPTRSRVGSPSSSPRPAGSARTPGCASPRSSPPRRRCYVSPLPEERPGAVPRRCRRRCAASASSRRSQGEQRRLETLRPTLLGPAASVSEASD